MPLAIWKRSTAYAIHIELKRKTGDVFVIE
jgi:hypothetical protein